MITKPAQFFVPDAEPGVLILLGLSSGVTAETANTTFLRCTLLHDGVFEHFQGFPLTRVSGQRSENYAIGAMDLAQDAAFFLKNNGIPAKGLKISNGSEFCFPCDRGGSLIPSISQCDPLNEEAHTGFRDSLRHTLRSLHHR